MKVKISIEGKEEEIEIKEPTGKDQRFYINELAKIQNMDKKDMQDTIATIDLEDELLLRLCPKFKTKEEIQNLTLADKHKIAKIIGERITGIGFVESTKNLEKSSN